MTSQDLRSLQPNARSSRIQEAWDRATSVGLLGALWLAAADVAGTPVIESAAAEETGASDSAPAAKPAVLAQAGQDSSADAIAQVGASPDASGAPPDAAATQDATPAQDTVGTKQAPAAHEHGSSTSLQLIEATFASQSLSDLLHQVNDEPAEPVSLVAAETTAEPVERDAGITIIGTDAADVILGTPGADLLIGGAGDDQIRGKGGNDNIRGGGGDDQVSGGSGDDTVRGGSGNDELKGESGNDTVDGGSGDDTSEGGSGNDAVIGGDGNDVVIGGLGADWLSGGEGDDCFQFNSLDDSGATEDTRDHILDFKQGADKIDLIKINADFEALGGQSLVFIGLAEFAPGQGQLRYQHLHGEIADDDRTFIELSHGDGHAHMQIELHGLFTMTVDDFLLF